MILSAWLGAQLEECLLCHSRAITSKVSDSSVSAAFWAFFVAAGSMPLSRSERASVRLWRASVRVVWGYVPRVRSFSVPPNRYFRRQSLPPVGVTRRKRPPPSKSLRGFVEGLVALTLMSVNGTIFFGITRSSMLLGVSPMGVYLRTPKHTPKLHGFYRISPDAIGQQKTRFPCGEAGLVNGLGSRWTDFWWS